MRHERIHRDPDIMSGDPVIVGTRIPVRAILNELSVGESEPAILEAYPRLTAADVRAAVAYAMDLLDISIGYSPSLLDDYEGWTIVHR